MYKLIVSELKIQPSEFWNMTILDCERILKEREEEKPMDRETLEDLMSRFPDQCQQS